MHVSKKTDITPVTSTKASSSKPAAKKFGKRASSKSSALSAVMISPVRGKVRGASASEGAVEVDVDVDMDKLFEGDIVGGEFILIGHASNKAQTIALAAQLTRLLEFREQSAEWFERTIAALMPPVDVRSAAETEQARLNTKLRRDYIKDIPVYKASDIAREAGSKATNKAQRASRLKREGRIFSVLHEGQTLFPAFQFDADINPKPVIAPVIEALEGRGLSGWQVGLWFATNSAVLGGARPLDLLDKDPERVVTAAGREAP